MPKSKELAPKATKFTDISSIMKDPSMKAKLSNFIDEAVTCKGAIAAQQTQIKGLRDMAVEELGLNPKLFSAYVAAAYNNDYKKRKDSLDEQVVLLEYIMGEAGFITDGSKD